MSVGKRRERQHRSPGQRQHLMMFSQLATRSSSGAHKIPSDPRFVLATVSATSFRDDIFALVRINKVRM